MLEVIRATPVHLRVLTAVYGAAVGLLPVALGFWVYHPVLILDYPPVYFTYSSVLLFAPDVLAAAALISDISLRLVTGRPLTGRPDPVAGAMLVLAGWAALSAVWSVEPWLSLYYGLHLGLTAGLAASLSARPEVWPAVAAGSLVAVVFQVGVGVVEVTFQTTGFVGALGLEWPGRLDPAVPGAAVVELPDGTRWLRAYGTFPHPNLLATCLVGLAAGPVSWALGEAGVRRALGVGGVALTAAGLGLTFSRAGWLGFLVGVLWVAMGRGIPARRRRWLVAAVAAGFLAAVGPFGPVLGVRLGFKGPLEARSVLERGWLVGQAAELVRGHGLLGLGAGTFALSLRDRLPQGYRAEPVHNVGVLILTELGPVGLIISLVAAAGSLAGLRRRAGPEEIGISGALLGLLVLTLLDPGLWTAAPGRLLGGLVVGAWVGSRGTAR